MKQVLQHSRTGTISVTEVPSPKLLPGCVLVRIAASLVSAGTERASSEFASKNLLQKANARPDLVREVVSKVRRDGLLSAVSAVRSRLDQPGALGYSSAGTVVRVAEGITDIHIGDRVACAGAGHAVHAEFACVPRLLVAKIPSVANVDFEGAAFATVGAVALHGIRIAEAKLGDVVAVIGLGLLGQLTLQLLKAAGCRVLGMDINPNRVQLALRMGADGVTTSGAEFRDLCLSQSGGNGVDTVLIAAETASSDPVNLASEVIRDRGIVVALGTVGMDLQRKLYYEKELNFRVSRSYGPGRYDSAYEQKGRDYPIGYVRWTETRNMQAFVQLLAEGKLDLKSLVTHRFPIDQAKRAYELIKGETGEPSLGVLITYSEKSEESRRLILIEKSPDKPFSDIKPEADISVGLLGAGNFATSTLLPAIKKISKVKCIGICAANGSHARHAGDRFGFRYCSTEDSEIVNDPAINTLVIATRHHLHAPQILQTLRAGKHVFCEKPLCLTEEELSEIVHLYSRLPEKPLLMVGFNRRFAPMICRMNAFIHEIKEPVVMHYRVNAGAIPQDHWTNDPEQGGGRILGEVCHFVDLLSFLADAPPIQVQAHCLANLEQHSGDNLIISLHFANGSLGTISYLANGDRNYSKERIEVFGGGATAVLEDFRRLELVRHGRKQTFRSRFRQDKGHVSEWQAFARAIRSGTESPIPFEQIVASTLATLRIVESRSSGHPMAIDAAEFLSSHSSSQFHPC
jgi:predicted dehydrogenase/threonine dehydrogenase-like Zn-dependent dehydrogenase